MLKEAKPYSGLQEVDLLIGKAEFVNGEDDPEEMMEAGSSTSAGLSKCTDPSTSAGPSTAAGLSTAAQVEDYSGVRGDSERRTERQRGQSEESESSSDEVENSIKQGTSGNSSKYNPAFNEFPANTFMFLRIPSVLLSHAVFIMRET